MSQSVPIAEPAAGPTSPQSGSRRHKMASSATGGYSLERQPELNATSPGRRQARLGNTEKGSANEPRPRRILGQDEPGLEGCRLHEAALCKSFLPEGREPRRRVVVPPQPSQCGNFLRHKMEAIRGSILSSGSPALRPARLRPRRRRPQPGARDLTEYSVQDVLGYQDWIPVDPACLLSPASPSPYNTRTRLRECPSAVGPSCLFLQISGARQGFWTSWKAA